MFNLFQVVVVTDYAEGELFQILEDDGNLPEEQVRVLSRCCLLCLFYSHHQLCVCVTVPQFYF